MNKPLRRRIVDMVMTGRDGHIPSAFSILDIVAYLYRHVLKFDSATPEWEGRDYFILSKGHGCLAQYIMLYESGFLTDKDMDMFCKAGGILGEHPDRTKVPGIEASTGSLGHGLPFSLGIALGLRVRNMNNRIFVLVGDGECHEGTIWESANLANNLRLGNVCLFVDWNGSAAQLMPHDDLPAKWRAFGWNTIVVDGHSDEEIGAAVGGVNFQLHGQPTAVIARTVKGKGAPLIEGHGLWHHRIPTEAEYNIIMESLS